MTLEEAIELYGAKRRGNRWRSPCPAHQGERESLSFTDHPDREQWLPHCFAGCAATDILSAMGLDYADTFYGSRDRRAYQGKERVLGHDDKLMLRAWRAASEFCREQGVDPAEHLTPALVEKVAFNLQVGAWPECVPYDLNVHRLKRISRELDEDEWERFECRITIF